MAIAFNINTDAAVVYANKLEKLNRSAFPNAVRATLNKAAFDVKQNTMPDVAGKVFVKRQANFFKANSKVVPAKGFSIQSMKAVVGFKPLSGTNKAIDDLQQQEHGGKIDGKSFIPTKEARASKSWNRNVKPNLRLQALKNDKIINAQKVRSKDKKQRFVKAAIQANKLYGKKAFVLGNVWKGNQTLSRIDKISYNRKKRTIKISRTPIYTYRSNRKITVAATNFMRRASHESGMKLAKIFQTEAIKQLNKLK